MDPTKWTSTICTDISGIPWEPGAYAFEIDSEIVYIGRAKMLFKRLNTHKKLDKLREAFKPILIKWCAGWGAYDNEQMLIDTYQPVINIDCKGPNLISVVN